MGIQFLGNVKYAPARDIYHILPAVVKTVAEHLLVGQPFQPLHAWLDSRGVSLKGVEQALAAYIEFLTIAQTEGGVRMTDALERSGWLRQPWDTQLAVMYYVGVVQTGVFFEGSQLGHDPKQAESAIMQALISAGRDLNTYVQAPWWKRWWLRRTFRSYLPIFEG
jgi:hypothetical protein